MGPLPQNDWIPYVVDYLPSHFAATFPLHFHWLCHQKTAVPDISFRVVGHPAVSDAEQPCHVSHSHNRPLELTSILTKSKLDYSSASSEIEILTLLELDVKIHVDVVIVVDILLGDNGWDIGVLWLNNLLGFSEP